MTQVSVVVPVYNAERHLRRCLDSLVAQTYPHREIVVADDGSTDGSRAVARDFGEIKILECGENRGPAYARNRAVEATGGELIVFVDADCVVDDPRWLEQHVAAHEGVEEAIVGGGVDGMGLGVIARADRYCHWLTNIPRSERRICGATTPRRRIRFSRHFVTTNMSVRRSTFARIGPFDETLATGEDVEFCERALALDVVLRFEPDIVVRHHDRERLGA